MTGPPSPQPDKSDKVRALLDRLRGGGGSKRFGAYESHKERARSRMARISRSGRDIGELPDVAEPDRRDACRLDFRLFCETYFPQRFTLDWSPDHLRTINRIERCVTKGELLALGMPRGNGKTTMITVAVIWAPAYGHRRFIAAIGAEKESVETEILGSINVELECNDLLLADFPEICFPIRQLEGITQKSRGQLYKGERTRMVWGQDHIILPTIPGALSSGAIIKTAGILGRVRGMQHTQADGQVIRPDLVLVDDPQTDASAHSETQCNKRERVIGGAILGLGGPGQSIAGFCPCTVIVKGDLSDRLLNRKLHPEWAGEKCKMIYRFPDDWTRERRQGDPPGLWEQYREIYLQGLEDLDENRNANAFYNEHRAAMDAGARVAWEQRYRDNELSALQHAMNWMFRDEHAFFAEAQNDPLNENAEAEQRLTADDIERKVTNQQRGLVPLASTKLVAFIDVQDRYLPWAVCAFDESFGGHLVDYGAWPKQNASYYTARDAKQTLARAYPGAGFEGKIYSGLDELQTYLTQRIWRDEAGQEHSIARILVDANWGESTDVVYRFCRETVHKSIITPSHGRGITAGQKPMSDWPMKPGDRRGQAWRITAVSRSRRAIRHVLIDTNWWKSFVAKRIRMVIGDAGSFTICAGTSMAHRMLVSQLTAEFPVEVHVNKQRDLDEWKCSPGRDNHLWDCVVGCHVAASMEGIKALGHRGKIKKKRERIRLNPGGNA